MHASSVHAGRRSTRATAGPHAELTLRRGDDAPEACSSCHDIGGDADEEKLKTRSVHSKNQGFPRTGDQEQTSCVGCHKSMNSLLKAGKREGEAAPTKCTACHKRKN